MHPAEVLALAVGHKAALSSEEACALYREPAARVNRKALLGTALTVATAGVLLGLAARR